MPLLLNQDKTKLSKRKGDVSLGSYIAKGYLKEALINFLALLGWNTPDDRELFTMEELLKEFSMERVHKAGAIVDPEKLNWINATYIRQLTVEDLAGRLLDFCAEELTLENDMVHHRTHAASMPLAQFHQVVAELQTRLVRLDEFLPLSGFFFKEPEGYDLALLASPKMKVTEELLATLLPNLLTLLEDIDSAQWNREDLKSLLLPWIQEQGLKNGQVLWPLRAALSGEAQSPGAFELAEILGQESTLSRLKKAIALLQA